MRVWCGRNAPSSLGMDSQHCFTFSAVKRLKPQMGKGDILNFWPCLGPRLGVQGELCPGQGSVNTLRGDGTQNLP